MPHKDAAVSEEPTRQKHIYHHWESWIFMKIKAVERGLKSRLDVTVLEAFWTIPPPPWVHLAACLGAWFSGSKGNLELSNKSEGKNIKLIEKCVYISDWIHIHVGVCANIHLHMSFLKVLWAELPFLWKHKPKLSRGYLTCKNSPTAGRKWPWFLASKDLFLEGSIIGTVGVSYPQWP